MNVVLVHPIHGAKVAINELEMEQDVKNGWTEYNPDTPVEVAPEPVADTPVEVAPEPVAEAPVEVAPEPVAEAPKRKYTRKQTDQPVEQPNEVPSFLTSASDECEGPRNGDSRGTDQ